MNKEPNSISIFRYIFVVLMMLGVAGFVLYKVVDNTIVHAAEWNKAAQKELSKTVLIEPERGNSMSANGTIQTTNLTFYNIRLDYRSEKFQEDTLRK
ncbi:MAG: hypothetical protein K2M98_05345, partial [Muribaculum sp.]|nr:hypothetical protein [Muribaculum sp.]